MINGLSIILLYIDVCIIRYFEQLFTYIIVLLPFNMFAVAAKVLSLYIML